MSPSRTLLAASGLLLLASCQSDGTGASTSTSSTSGEGCQPGLGSHLCSSGPSDPNLGIDPSIQAQGGAGRGGGH